jgi:replicative DNA helicase Mcm
MSTIDADTTDEPTDESPYSVPPKLDADIVDTCKDALIAADVDVATFAASYPNETVFDVPITDVKEYNETLVSDWRDSTDLLAEHFVEAVSLWLPDEADSEMRSAFVDNVSVRLVGYTDDELYDVGRYAPDEVIGRSVHIRGRVTKRSKRKLRDELIVFECERCGERTPVPQSGQELTEPHECMSCERQGPFIEDETAGEMRNYQNIRLQTLPEQTEHSDTSDLDVILFDDHVGSVTPGDRIVATVEMKGVRKDNSRVKELQGDVRSYIQLDEEYSDIDIEPYEDEIREIAAGTHDEYDDPREAIIPSIAPSHAGDDAIKEAIAYQIFGGVEKELPDGTQMRGNSHVLLMGDPGTGKSKMIKYVAELVPRSENATGKRSSAAGLTATVQQNEFENGSWTLEAGTLVKANNGLAAIDELDKIDAEDREGMMEAMSDQQITVSMVKSGVLPAKCSVLAAANPKYGTFEPKEPLDTQLDLSPVLLSRFDLWFTLQDTIDEERDSHIAHEVTATARAGERAASGADPSDTEWDEPPLPPEMFRAYVSMAQDIYPVMTDDARDMIVAEYTELRQSNGEDGPIPTNTRVVTALHRLSEASARIRLADTVTTDDVQHAINILMESLESMTLDPKTGDLDATRYSTGEFTSMKDDKKIVKQVIDEHDEDSDGAGAIVEDVREFIVDEDILDPDRFDGIMEKLRAKGEVYEPATGEVRTT